MTPQQAMALPLTRDLVLVGGGHAHALVLRAWGMNPVAGVRLTLISPDPVTAYTGMLPGMVAGHYRRDQIMIDLVRLAQFAGARLILSRVTGIDRAARQVMVAGRGMVAYDVLSLDLGVATGLPDLPGFADHGLAAKPMTAFADRWQAFCQQAQPNARVAVIGAGLGGVELALAARHRLPSATVTVIDRAQVPLGGVGMGARAALLAQCDRAGVRLVCGVAPVAVTADAVMLADGGQVGADLVLAVAGGQPAIWLAETGLNLVRGYVAVSATLQTVDPAIFACGDIAEMTASPRPKAGVFAVRQAPVLHHNLAAVLTGGPLRRFRPQRDYLKLVSTGGRTAVADKWGLRLGGPLLWRWKDRIDRAFMARFDRYPAMPAATVPANAASGLAEALADRPLCGGCGAKVAAADLSAALVHLPPPSRADVISGTGDDAAVLRAGTGFQVITTDHLRGFVEDPWLMARIAAVHASGDVWAMGARPQVALAQVILPRMSGVLQARTLREIMAAAVEVFGAAGADVVGGHTSVGAELTIGFTVTGTADRIIFKGGARPGDALILTKPLGTGTILAARMAGAQVPGAILGEVVAGAFAAMARPLDAAAAVLVPQARAMTDVTGFGLAGHLLEMLDASGCAAVLDLAAVPMLPGAVALAAAGQASSLAPANRAVAGRMQVAESPEAALLFDPQTAGGLLAAVPREQAAALVARLRDAGETAAVIGQLVAGPPFVTFCPGALAGA